MLSLIKPKIWRHLMYCNSCSLFSANRAAILGSHPNILTMRNMHIAVEEARQHLHNTSLCQRPHFQLRLAHVHPSNCKVNPEPKC